MKDLISKLNTLKSIEPEENWVVETRERVLSEAPVLGWKMTEVRNKQENGVADKFFSREQISRDADLSRLCECDECDESRRDKSASLRHIYTNLFSKRLAVSAFSLVFMVSGGAFTVEASKSSLPGDSLYIVKITTEDVALVVASKEKRPEIEIRQAGKRLEELTKISQKQSDRDQKRKTEQLLASFERKVNNAQSNLTKIENNGVKAKVARVINVQTEKYTEVLAETSKSLPDVVKIEMSEKFASAVDSNEKVNFQSLAMIVETMGEDEEGKEEIAAKVREKIEKLEERFIISSENIESENSKEAKDNEEEESVEDSDKNENITEKPTDVINESDNAEENGEDSEDLVLKLKTPAEEAKESLEKAKMSLKSNNLSEAMETVISVNIAVNLIDSEDESDPAGDEQTEDGSHGDEEEGVEGVSEEGEEGECLKEDSLE